MSKRKSKLDLKKFKQLLPYFITGVLTLALVFVGSLDKRGSSQTLNMDIFAENNYKVSVDQLSELVCKF